MLKIKAFFEDMSDARKTVEILKSNGYGSAHLDMVEGFYEEYSEEVSAEGNPGCSLMNMALTHGKQSPKPSLGGFTCRNSVIDTIGSFRVLQAAGTSLAVSADNENLKDVINIIRENGGTVSAKF